MNYKFKTINPSFKTRGRTQDNEEEILALQPEPVQYNDHIIYPDKVRINLEYMQRRNIWLDLKIIIFTVLNKKLTEEWAK